MHTFFNNRLKVGRLSDTPINFSEPYPMGFGDYGKGPSCFLSMGEPLSVVGLIHVLPAFPRGGHSHKKRREMIYVIEGTLHATYLDPLETNKPLHLQHAAGDFVMIQPGIAHRYACEAPALFLELSPEINDSSDFYPVAFS